MAYIYHTYGYNLELLYTSLDMVALATITDVVTLQEENRWFVTQGLKLMNEKPSYLFQTMKKVMKINGEVKSGTLGFQYGPLVNAVGRLEKDVNEVVEVFLSEDQVFIMNKIEVYKKLNEERKRITLEQVEKVYSQVDLSQKAIVVYDEHLGEGIIGLVAGNLKETYNRPTIVFTKGEDGNLKGSARSIEAFPVKEKLDGLKDLLLGYGGHMLAAGLGVTQDNYQQFKQQFIALANQKLTEEDIEKKYEYITCLEEGEINNQIYDAINRLEPYGTGFEAPYFKFEGLEIKECRAMGKPDPIHIRLTTQQNTTILGWRLLDKYEKMSPKKTREVLGTIEKNEFRGKVSYQIAILNDNLR